VSRIASPAQGAVIWCAVRAAFACRSCGFPSPLEGVVVADGIECAQCGSFQRFDKSVWSALLGSVHEVADLGGPNPEGRFPNPEIWIGDANKFVALGVAATFANAKSGDVSIDICPGFPVCKACKRPFDIRFEQGIVTTHCSSCNASATYTMPPDMAAFAPKAVAIVAEEQRHGRVEARVHAGDAGVVTMTCPQCGAALKGSDGASSVECTYCHTLAFIPTRARPKGVGRIAKPIVFFIAFNGPSDARAALEAPSGLTEDEIKEEKKAAGDDGIMSRGLSPIPGVALAPKREGLDVKQWALTIGLTVLALAVGYVLKTLIF
jgi:LSD1 subclass zinc finger protein